MAGLLLGVKVVMLLGDRDARPLFEVVAAVALGGTRRLAGIGIVDLGVVGHSTYVLVQPVHLVNGARGLSDVRRGIGGIVDGAGRPFIGIGVAENHRRARDGAK